MNLSSEDVQDILRLLDTLPFAEAELETSRFVLRLRRVEDGIWAQDLQVRPPTDGPATEGPATDAAEATAGAGPGGQQASPAGSAVDVSPAHPGEGSPGGSPAPGAAGTAMSPVIPPGAGHATPPPLPGVAGPASHPVSPARADPGALLAHPAGADETAAPAAGAPLAGAPFSGTGGPPHVDGAPSDQAAVRAPLMGTFYRAPQPGAAPFVEAGTQVGPETVVAIIETMKLMNPVYAGTSGTVGVIAVHDGQFVERDAVLMLVRTPGTGSTEAG